MRPRSAGGAPPQAFDSSAACAALTARSTSAFVAFATVASGPPVEGSQTSNVPPSEALDALAVDDELFGHESLPRTARQRGAVVRSVDLRLDQASVRRTSSASPTARSSSASVAAAHDRHAEAPRQAPASRSAPSATPAGSSRRACCLISIRLSDASLNTMVMMRSFSRDRRQQLADAHQQPAVAGQRDHRPLRDRAAPRQSPPAARTPSSTGRWR